jgi:hypothetical protein
MALTYVPRSSTPAALISLVSELSSSSESEVEQEEPIVIEALLVAAHHGDLPFIRCVRKPRSTVTRADRLVAVCHICVEIAQSRQFVFHCFHCEKFTLGYLCYQHHTRTCLNANLDRIAQWVAFRERNFAAPSAWRWIDCDYCIRQETLAARYRRLPYKVVIHWARFWTGLFRRQIRHMPMRCSATLYRHLTRHTGDCETSVPEPLQFFFVALGLLPHLASAIADYL